MESILGKAYFAFMCARWAVLFFWEAGWTTETTMDALLRVEGWKVTHGHWQDCTVHQGGQKERCVIKSHFYSSHHHVSLEKEIAKEAIFLEAGPKFHSTTNMEPEPNPLKGAGC